MANPPSAIQQIQWISYCFVLFHFSLSSSVQMRMPFQSGKKYLPRVLSVLTSKTNSDKPDSHVIFFIFFDGSCTLDLLFASFAVFAIQAANSACVYVFNVTLISEYPSNIAMLLIHSGFCHI